ncbi:MAG: efflux RND transporter permease subunit [Magnetococcales bacterium]|nr:efflux RND transporter permease subunit [Magnetococcales bacterium]
MKTKMTISGRVAAQFQNSEITPLLALVGFILGLFAVVITPQEEEPQISVTFANVFIPFPGASATEVEQVVAIPAEQIISEVEGVKHIYSQSRPGMAVLTVQFEVGEDRNGAILRLYNAVFSHEDFLPYNLGVQKPLVKPMGIDDVPIVSFTLWSTKPTVGAYELSQTAHTLEAELKRIPGTRNVYTIGGVDRVVRVELDPVLLSGHGMTLERISQTLNAFNVSSNVGGVTLPGSHRVNVQVGTYLASAEEVADLVIDVRDGKPITLKDVAKVSLGPDQPQNQVWFGTGPAYSGPVGTVDAPAVTLVVAKKPGTNAASIAQGVIDRMEKARGFLIPDDVQFTVTRNYGATAAAKASKLIGKLAFATFFVVLLVLFTMGWREALIVGTAVVLTLALTLFANWAWGFTLNRVSLFALIFSIGILVDDAIVVVENIHRHMHGSSRSLLDIIPSAVDEVGGPTILATFTVISALLPMAFVTGLMGPYMSPIPINASTGMLISLVVAFVVTPWLTYKGLGGVHQKNRAKLAQEHHGHEHRGETAHTPMDEAPKKLMALFGYLYRPFIASPAATRNRIVLGLCVLGLIVGSIYLVYDQKVVLKMLPFDDKSEFQVIVDMPEGTPVEETGRVMSALGGYLATVAEVTDYQIYSGTASAPGFNGLVRQYYLRKEPHMGDIQVNLADKHHRHRKSHEIALSVREPLQKIGREFHANVKVVEVPPGPPVQSPLVVEVYGPRRDGQRQLAENVLKTMSQTPDIVDVDSSMEANVHRWVLQVDRVRAARLGVSQRQVSELVAAALHGRDVSFLHTENAKYPIPIRVALPVAAKSDLDILLNLEVPQQRPGEKAVPLREFVRVVESPLDAAIDHKDLVRVIYVTGDMAGKLDSPLYGMGEIYQSLEKVQTPSGVPLVQHLIAQPEDQTDYSIKWDGEWQVTYETFRDMGIAYGVGLLMIYLLVVAQFSSYVAPLVIMAPIPLTIIGVMPGHAILGAQFTATSMIGMIALAGIIVRNSILLVDFINETVAKGVAPDQAVTMAGAIRSKPIVLTGLAAMLGAFFILDDPIFGGLAIALIFGIFVSTLLTLWIIPILYYPLAKQKTVTA